MATPSICGNFILEHASWNMRLQIAFLFPKLAKEQEMMMEQRLKQIKAQQTQQK